MVRFHSGVPIKKCRQSLVLKGFDGFYFVSKLFFNTS
nr:MAG TPA: hypothetical protein [Caudoviricetes sp.]